MKQEKTRQSNFELMRIISMFFIAGYHYMVHGGVLSKTTGTAHLVAVIFTALFLVHVNSFVLLTGYFNYDKEFRLSKLIKTNNSIWFYKVVCLIIILLFTSFTTSKLYILKTISPIPRFDDYWFLIAYMALYLISPALNLFIKNSDRTKHKKIILALLLITIISYLTKNEFLFSVNNGYSLFSFILLYFIGSYIHKYPIEKSSLFKDCSRKKIMLYSSIFYLLFTTINILLCYVSQEYLFSSHETVRYYSDTINVGFMSYINPLVLLSTLFYFVFFTQLKFSNKIVNFYGKNILGVYLITENFLIRPWVYKLSGYTLESYSVKYVLFSLVCSLVIILVCPLIEYIRVSIFKLCSKTKLATKLRKFVQVYISSFGFNIKW